MKILLTAVNAKYIHSNLAVYSIRANAKEYRDQIELGEYTINQYVEDILQDIYKKKPDLIAFSCYIWNIRHIRELVRELRKVLPNVPIWLGGPEASYDAKGLLEKYPEVTGVLVGEGEESFYELCRYYDGKRESLEEVRGLCFRDIQRKTWISKSDMANKDAVPEKGEVSHTVTEYTREKSSDLTRRSVARNESEESLSKVKQKLVETGFALIKDLSSLAFAYEDFNDFAHKIIYYESSRGCPFSCSYCLSSIDKSVRFRDLELVRKELQTFIDAKVPQVKFVDRTFNCKASHAMAIWQFLQEHDNGVTNFHFEVAADLITEEMLALFAKMRKGLIQLEIGVQSINEDTICEIRRKMDFEKVAELVTKVKNMGNIHQHLDLIAGLPNEDYKSFGKSFDAVFALRPEQLQLGFLKVLKGSYMYENREAYGLVYRSEPPYEVLSTNWVTYDEMIHLKGIEQIVELYYNSHQYDRTLESVFEGETSAFGFFESLADDYRAKGHHMVNHSRKEKYYILKDFLDRRYPEKSEYYWELLKEEFNSREVRKIK